jgi:hypothetical protein
VAFKKNYCKYTEKKLIFLFNVIPLDFNASVPSFHKFFLIPPEKSSLVASLTNFAWLQFLDRIFTADETWVHHCEPKSEALSMVWKRPKLPMAKKLKSQPSAGKIMLTIFLGQGRCDFGLFHSEG